MFIFQSIVLLFAVDSISATQSSAVYMVLPDLVKVGGHIFLIPVLHQSPFSLKSLILWSPNMAESKLTTQSSFSLIV